MIGPYSEGWTEHRTFPQRQSIQAHYPPYNRRLAQLISCLPYIATKIQWRETQFAAKCRSGRIWIRTIVRKMGLCTSCLHLISQPLPMFEQTYELRERVDWRSDLHVRRVSKLIQPLLGLRAASAPKALATRGFLQSPIQLRRLVCMIRKNQDARAMTQPDFANTTAAHPESLQHSMATSMIFQSSILLIFSG